MDKRFKSMTPIEQMQRRPHVLDTIEQHPE